VIRGYFDESKLPALPRVLAAVYLPGITAGWVVVDFVLDTGASTTCIHPLDAITRLHIDQGALADDHQWTHSESYGGIGGNAVTYYRVPATYLFPATERPWPRHTGNARLAQLRPFNQMIQSLLGWDVLQHFRLVIDWPSRLVELHPAAPPPPRRRE
jgi:hypothetical protein